jgi:hypothetical protein
MVAGFHFIWTAYGWWLPNDPRGSSSHEIRVERIAELGDLHHGRKAVQPAGREIRPTKNGHSLNRMTGGCQAKDAPGPEH